MLVAFVMIRNGEGAYVYVHDKQVIYWWVCIGCLEIDVQSQSKQQKLRLQSQNKEYVS